MCDGVFHCIFGEDESLEACKDTYPEGATIKCIEDRLDGVDLTIMAVPCDGVKECRSREDENCELSNVFFWSIVGTLFLVTIVVWAVLNFIVSRQKPLYYGRRVKSRFESDCKRFKGNKLADLKVIEFQVHTMYRKTYNTTRP